MLTKIQRLGYHPQTAKQLDLEVFSMADLRLRGKEQVRVTHRYEFHAVVCVTRGRCTQMVDFEAIACEPGSLLILRAGQAHNYGQEEDWDGWNLLFRPEFVLPVASTSHELKLALDIERLPGHQLISTTDFEKIIFLLAQMREDSMLDAPQEDVHRLLLHQLQTLLARLSLLEGRRAPQDSLVSPASQRFWRFQQLVEKNFPKWHQVADYGKQLGYSDKTLARAVMSSMDISAKAYITARIVLEAKRLLVHTDLHVVSIAEKLGFEEGTNFGKFFKREAGCTPAEFRRRQEVQLNSNKSTIAVTNRTVLE